MEIAVLATNSMQQFIWFVNKIVYFAKDRFSFIVYENSLRTKIYCSFVNFQTKYHFGCHLKIYFDKKFVKFPSVDFVSVF